MVLIGAVASMAWRVAAGKAAAITAGESGTVSVVLRMVVQQEAGQSQGVGVLLSSAGRSGWLDRVWLSVSCNAQQDARVSDDPAAGVVLAGVWLMQQQDDAATAAAGWAAMRIASRMEMHRITGTPSYRSGAWVE